MLLGVAVIATLHSCHHIRLLTTDAIDELVIRHLDALPAFVTVHGIETTDDRSDMRTVGIAYLLQVSDESLTATRVGIAAIHEAVYESLVRYTVLLSYLDKFEQMVEGRMYASIGAQAHDMELLAGSLRSLVCRDDLRITHDGVVADRTVDFHEVLIDDTSGTDIEVSHFGVTHLSVGQTYVLAARLELRVRIFSQQRIPVRRRRDADDIGFTLVADSPAIQNH